MAIAGAGRNDPCDMVLLFSTVRHDQYVLREAVVSETGANVPVYGGGTAGVITNEYYGYAGDQIAVRGTDELREGTQVTAKQAAPA